LANIGAVSGDLVRVVSRWGSALARVRASGDLPAGMAFMPIHWSEQFARSSRVGAAVNPVVDALSGEPELTRAPVRLEDLVVEWRGLLLSRERVEAPDAIWWARLAGDGEVRLDFAGSGAGGPGAAWLKAVLPS